MRIALFPGSFDPITIGHYDILERAKILFDKIYIGVGKNSSKQCLFSLDERLLFLNTCFAGDPKIEITQYDGLTVNFCLQINAQFILRGLRSDTDFEYEKNIAQINKEVEPTVETVFMVCSPAYSAVSSTIVKDIKRNGGNISRYIPKALAGII
ncbi:MAG: pantetheine-phosphate adenylyltransferase [Bacteroidetes bacterium]|nr:pantetheine-phosphate adenylyltransferase [Bacteroidota bacterium]